MMTEYKQGSIETIGRESETTKHLWRGKWLRVVKRNNWEFIERTNAKAIVTIIPITDDDNIVLIKQYREPLQKIVIEVPAGLVGDIDKDETIETAACRELLEETGYFAQTLGVLPGTFPISPGISTEQLTYVIATDLEKQTEGGGDASEKIEVFELPVISAADKLMKMAKQGDVLVDAKLFASILFACPIIAARIQKRAGQAKCS